MGRGKICTVDGFAYSPHSNMQGRAGESSPALLCLCFPLNAFDFFDGKWISLFSILPSSSTSLGLVLHLVFGIVLVME